MSAQASFLSIAHTKKLRCETFLNEMETIVPWGRLLLTVEPHYPHHNTGRRRKELKMMLKILCLQQWYNLSDAGMEEDNTCSFS